MYSEFSAKTVLYISPLFQNSRRMLINFDQEQNKSLSADIQKILIGLN